MKELKRTFHWDSVPYSVDKAMKRAAKNTRKMTARKRRDSEDCPGGPAQTLPSRVSAADDGKEKRGGRMSGVAMPRTVDELVTLFKNGHLTPGEAYAAFLDLRDTEQMTEEQARKYFYGREDSLGARERMLRRMGLR